MRGRSPLVLMEQVIMLAVFALAAALCLRVFVLSDQLSRQGEIRDQALLQAQSAAEVYRHCQGQGDQAVELAGGSWDGPFCGMKAGSRWSRPTRRSIASPSPPRTAEMSCWAGPR